MPTSPASTHDHQAQQWPRDPGDTPPEQWPSWCRWQHSNVDDAVEDTTKPARSRAAIAVLVALLVALLVAVDVATVVAVWPQPADPQATPASTTAAAAPDLPAGGANADFPAAEALDNIVLIATGNGAQTGIIIDDRHIVTAAIAVGQQATVVGDDGEQETPSAIVNDDATATSVLTVGSTAPYGERADVAGVSGQEVNVASARPDRTLDPITLNTTDIVGDPARPQWLAGRAGMDTVALGAPVVDNNGNVVGMITHIEPDTLHIQEAAPVWRRAASAIAGTPTAPATVTATFTANTTTVATADPASGLQTGDMIMTINGQTVTSEADIRAAVSTAMPGDTATATLTRQGRLGEIAVTLT